MGQFCTKRSKNVQQEEMMLGARTPMKMFSGCKNRIVQYEPISRIYRAYETPNRKYICILTNATVIIYSQSAQLKVKQFRVQVSFFLGLKTVNGSDDSKYILFQVERGIIYQWSTKHKKVVHKFRHLSKVLDIVMNSKDNFWVSTRSEARLWDLKYKSCLRTVVNSETKFIYLFLQNGLLYSNAYSSQIFVHDMKEEENTQLKKFDHIKESDWANFGIHSDGRTLVQTHQFNGLMWIVDLKTSKVRTVTKHTQRVLNLAFTWDGQYLITSSQRELVAWRVSDWSVQLFIKEENCIVTGRDRKCCALIVDNVYRSWSDENLSFLQQNFLSDGEKLKHPKLNIAN